MNCAQKDQLHCTPIYLMKAVIAFPLTTTTTVGCFCVTCLCYEYRSNVAAATTSVQAGFEVLTQVYTLSDESSYCKYLQESGKKSWGCQAWTQQIIRTKGARTRPLTNDDHHIHSIPTKPLNELINPHMIPGRPPMN